MRDTILTAMGILVLTAGTTMAAAEDREPTTAKALCSAQANFYADAIFSFQMEHQAAVDRAGEARQAVPAFDRDRSIAVTLAETPARGLPKPWRAGAVEAVYSQVQFVVWSPAEVRRFVYSGCLSVQSSGARQRASRPN